MTAQTFSSVHSAGGMLAQRQRARRLEQYTVSGLSVYAQTVIGFSLYLYDGVSSPGWLSLLLTAPYALLLGAMGGFLARRAKGRENAVYAAAGPRGGRIFFLSFSLLHLMDAQIVFYALCAMLRNVMPDHSVLWMALGAGAVCAAALAGEGKGALPRLAKPLKALVGVLFLYCLVIALPHGKAAHFFPLLGYGPASILRGAGWMAGAVWSGAWPALSIPPEENDLLPEREKRFSPVSWLRALVAGTLTYLVSVWLMPVYALARPQTLGWRMLLVAHMTPSVPAWSMEVMGLALLLLFCLCVSVQACAESLGRFSKRQKQPRFLLPALFLLMIPACVLDTPEVNRFFVAAAPFRGPAAAGLAGALCLASLLRGKRAGREAGA